LLLLLLLLRQKQVQFLKCVHFGWD
jgi:hypothetical protein